MKKIITTSIFVLFLVCSLKAQTSISVPKCFEPSAILYVTLSGSDVLFNFCDGLLIHSYQKVTPTPKLDIYSTTIYPHTSYAINEMIKQGYELKEVIYADFNRWTYYFIKK